MADQSLDLLGLPLVDGLPNEEHGYEFGVYGDETRFGVATSAQEIVTSLLADGDLVRITRFGNREVSFPVEITGPSLASLAHGEAALRAVVGRGGDLVWQPPDALAVPTAFDVITSTMEFRFDDLSELRKRRVFLVTLTCLPFGRSVAAVTVPALPAPGAVSTLTITNADTVTNWSASSGGSAVTVTDGGAFVQASFGAASLGTMVYSIAAPVALGSRRYVLVEMSGSTPTYFGFTNGSGYVGASPMISRATASGTVLHVFDVGSGYSFRGITITRKGSDPAGMVLAVHDITASTTLPQVSPRQITRVIEVGGTERTPASIHVESTVGDGLGGLVLVHTSPEDGSGYSPPLRRWRTSGSTGVTSDATTLSGAYEPIAMPSGFGAEVPTSALPEGGYLLVARIRVASGAPADVTVYYSTATILPGSTDQQGFTNGSVKVTLSTTAWHLVPLTVLSLPTVRAASGKVQVNLQTSNTHAATHLDEAWLFRDDDDCALSVVASFQKHLWLDSPDATSPVPRVWIGANHISRNHPGGALMAMGDHVLNPEGTAVFTAALSDNPATDAEFHRRWHTNAAS